MSVPVQTPSKEYIANGTTTAFPLEFNCDKAEYLIITLNGEEAPVGSWTLANDTVTFNVAPLNGVVVNLERNTPFQRTTNYQLYDNSFRPSAVNKDFDLIWWKLQELGYRDQVIWLALVKEITDRIAGDDGLQNQINTIDQQVELNTQDIAKLVNDLSKEVADRIKGDKILKDMFLSMIDEAINEGTINALAITHVDSLNDLGNVENVWDGRIIYVKDVALFKYDGATEQWHLAFNSSQSLIDASGKNQQEINEQILNAKTVDLSYLKPPNGFDISDLVNAILVKTSDTPIELILPKADYFVIEKQLITPEDSKGITIDLNGAIIKAGPNNPNIDYLFVLYSTTNNPIVVKNGKIDGSLRAQNLFESTNVQDLKLGANGITCNGRNILFENLEISHLYGQTTRCFCANLIVRNVNIDDCGGHWYQNDGYDMFGDAFYIGTGWNDSGVINVSFENVKANGKHSDQYPENHQPGSPLTLMCAEKTGGFNLVN